MPTKLKKIIPEPEVMVQDVPVKNAGEELDIRYCHPQQLTPHPRNARVHPEENLKMICNSIKQFGQRTPIVIWLDPESHRHYILKGNGTHQAMVRLGRESIAYVDASHLPPADADAYALVDNKASDSSHFDQATLSMVMRDLEQKSYDLDLTGFNPREREPLLQDAIDEHGQELKTGDDSKSLKFTADEIQIIKDAAAYIRTIETEFDVTSDTKALVALCYRATEQQLKWAKNVPF